MAHGEKKAVFEVRNSNGGRLGRFSSIEKAEKVKAETERRYASDKFGNAALKVFVVEL